MIASLFFTHEAFAARRRKAQDAAVKDLLDEVRLSIKDHGVTDHLLVAMQQVYEAAYHDEIDGDAGIIPATVQKQIDTLISHTTPESDPTATALAIVNLLINTATVKAAQDDEDDLFLEWVTMHDGAVRQTHKDTDGQVRPIGEKFDVDGQAMSMPGDITAPIEFWINCRCTLRPTIPNAGEFQSTESLRDVSTDERKKRSKDGTALPDGSYPIANCSDLKNAIQAIGRAKDPAKAKAHIRKRKSALGCPDVPIPDSWAISLPTIGSNPRHTWLGNQFTTGPFWPSIYTTTSTGGSFTVTTQTDEKTEPDLSTLDGMDEEQVAALEMLVPWHGVLAPEGVASGDGRTFAPDALSNRDLPLPLTYQKTQDEAHKGSVVVGSIETLERKDGLMLASGWMLSTPEADEVIGLMAHFGKYGVSVDADEVEFEFDEASETVTFSKARICSASLVSIPAFAEAYVALGPWEEDEALVASGVVFKDLAPGLTEDGPGWLTHPVDTDRLRDYWVRGAGAAKIGWGTPGDFNRCRLNLAKYVKPQYLSGYCANRHYDALGFWPGRPVSADTIPFAEGTPAPALTLVSSAAPIEAPAEWFADPNLDKPTHLTVTKEGRVYGHVAQWGTCHIGMQGVCTEPPKSDGTYPSFANKQVLLDNGEFVRTGVITIGGKHAPGAMGLRAASRHYDDTTQAVSDVAVGDDEHGIWVAGWVRPGTSEENVVALRGSDISGDWRSLDGISPASELVGVLAVNNGGFNIRVAASNGNVVSLVAAGMIQPTDDMPELTERLAEAFMLALDNRDKKIKVREKAVASLREKYQTEGE